MSKINKNKTNKMKRIIRLTEKDLSRLIKRMIHEVDETQYAEPSAELYASLEKNVDKDDDDESMTQQVAEYWARRRRLQESQMMMDVYPKITKCYDEANKVSKKKFSYPTVCKSGLSQGCIDKLKVDASAYAGANKLSSKLGYCLTKIDKKIADSQQGLG